MKTKTITIAAALIAVALFTTGCTNSEPVAPAPTTPAVATQTPATSEAPAADGEFDDFVEEQNAGAVVPLDGTQTTVTHEGQTFDVPAGATDVRFKQNDEGTWVPEFTFPVTDDELGDAIESAEQG